MPTSPDLLLAHRRQIGRMQTWRDTLRRLDGTGQPRGGDAGAVSQIVDDRADSIQTTQADVAQSQNVRLVPQRS